MISIPFLRILIVTTLFVQVTLALPRDESTSSPASSSNNTNVFGTGEPKQGWTSSPDGRGTLDIIWSSLTTSFLCCWSVLCMNVSGSDETDTSENVTNREAVGTSKSRWRPKFLTRSDKRAKTRTHKQARRRADWIIYRRKTFLALFTLFAPEVVCSIAMGQFHWARVARRQFQEAAEDDALDPRIRDDLRNLTLEDSFILNMGGFILELNGECLGPINASQLLEMIKREHINVPREQLNMLADKNKVDGVLRFVMVLQALWYALSVLGRLVQRITVTTMETTTVSFIYCAAMFMILWWHKPADIATPETLRLKIEDVEAKNSLIAYLEEPTVPSVGRGEEGLQRGAMYMYFAYFRAVLRKLGLPVAKGKHRVVNMTSDDIPGWFFWCGTVACLIYCAPFVAHWKSVFPTRAEQILWRIASVGTVVTLFFSLVLTDRWIRQDIELKMEDQKPAAADAATPTEAEQGTGEAAGQMPSDETLVEMSTLAPPGLSTPRGGQPRSFISEDAVTIAATPDGAGPNAAIDARDIESGKPQAGKATNRLPTKVVVSIWILGTIHVICRSYILIEDALELRSLPQSAYESVEWSDMLPHIK